MIYTLYSILFYYIILHYIIGNAFAGLGGLTYMLHVANPNAQDLACTLGRPCAMLLSGSGLNPSNRLRWLLSGSTCGSATCTDAPNLKPFRPTDAGVTYDFGSLADVVPGSYTLCWASLGQARALGESSNVVDCLEYYEEIGTVSLTGPLSFAVVGDTESGVSAAGRDFSLRVTGVALAETNRIQVVDYAVVCGNPRSATASQALVSSSLALAGTHLNPDYEWAGLQLSLAGTYRVCWCSGAASCAADAEQS